jgi:hypothetical protein
VTQAAHVCRGCVASQAESTSVQFHDGTSRDGQKVRCYSWVVANGKRIAATKSHRDWLLSVCLYPPPPPFVICISDSGQKHLLYRAVVCHDQKHPTVTLEGERIDYGLPGLRDRVDLCQRIAAVTGKPALDAGLSFMQQIRVVEHYDSDQWLSAWLAVATEPLSRLSLWLCPPRSECLLVYPQTIGENAKSVGFRPTLF